MMHSYSFILLGAALCLENLQVSASQASSSARADTSTWPGWSGIEYAFIFGDSYTTTGFNLTLTQPSASNPLGNPSYPGYTSSNGPNWIDYLTTKYNASLLQTYNLAYGGATVNSTLVTPYLPTVLSLADQITLEFLPTYGTHTSPPWTPSTTLFALFIGINDIGNSYHTTAPNTSTLNAEIIANYASLITDLIDSGAANLLLLTVPPVQRSPLTTIQGNASIALEAADIADFNTRVRAMAHEFKTQYNAGVEVFLYDTYALFDEVLDDPAAYAQTAGYKNTTAYCTAYENGTPTENYYDPTCGIPVNEYFWLNSLHPTYPVHDVLAQQVAATLEAGPNVK